MPITTDKVSEIKTIAAGKDVIILIDGGQTVSGVLSEITPDYVILKSKNETVYLTADVIKALKIRL